jgi:hypothetical protein
MQAKFSPWKVTIGEVASLVGIVFTAWTWFFPHFGDFLDSFRGADLRYMMVTSGTDPAAFPINLRTRARVAQAGKESPLSLIGIFVVNSGNKRAEDAVQINVDNLSTPIVELVVEPHKLPLYLLEPCSGVGVFKPEDQVGQQRFCFQIKTFPERSVVSIFLLSQQASGPVIRSDKMFIGTTKDPTAAKPVQIDQLPADTQKARVHAFAISVFLVFLMFAYVIRGRVRHA